MPRRRNLFFDTYFNEWLFDQLTSLNKMQTANLNHSELRMIRTETHIKKFIANENLEKKLSLLTKVGLQWNLSFFAAGIPITAEYLKNNYKQYTMTGITVENVERMIRDKVFVINSRDMAIAMSLMSINCHSEIYLLNPNFTKFKRTRQTVKQAYVKKQMSLKNTNVLHNDIKAEVHNLIKLVMGSIEMEDYIIGVQHLQMLDMMILWKLYLNAQNYIDIEVLKRELRHMYKPQSVGLRCVYLWRERKMIDKRASFERSPSYIIAQEGIITVGMINNHIVNTVYSNA